MELLKRYRDKLVRDAGSAVGISLNSAVHDLLISDPPFPEKGNPDAPTYSHPMPEGIAESDAVDFVRQRCVLGSQYSMSARDLYANFQDWCEETGANGLSQRGFGMQLTAMGLRRKRRHGGTHWWGGIRISEVGRAWSGQGISGEDAGKFGTGPRAVIGRPQSRDEVIQSLLDGLFSGALNRGIDLQLSLDGSGRWISFPDNYMSLLIQPRNRALLLTAYGKPESFGALRHTLQMKVDRPSYVRFHIRSEEDLPRALEIIDISLQLRSQKLHSNTPRFEPLRTVDVKPLRRTGSFLATPSGLDTASIIGQQIRSQGANRCLIVVTHKTIAEEMQRRLFRRFSLSGQIIGSEAELRRASSTPNSTEALFIVTHVLFKELSSDDLVVSRQETSWDLVTIDSARELLQDKLWWDSTGRNLLKNLGFTRHLSLISSLQILKEEEDMAAIHELLDQRPLPYWYEACEPRDAFKETGAVEEFAAHLPTEKDSSPADSADFVSQTYFTRALRQTIREVAGRLGGGNAPGLIRIAGGFGSGKTHTLMVLYHLINHPDEAIRNVNVEATVEGLPLPDDARAFFINGTDLGTETSLIDDGEIEDIPPLWRELARQIDPNFLTSMMEDRRGRHHIPARELYRSILEAASPCVVLVDETAAYLHRTPSRRRGLDDLNTLAELSQVVDRVAVVFTSLEEPVEFRGSPIDIFGDLDGRVLPTDHTPVEADEILEVVKRRLFQSIDRETGHLVAAAYHRLYISAPHEFEEVTTTNAHPELSYPFHPQLIDLLYSTDSPYSSPSSPPKLRWLLQMLAGIVSEQWTNRQSAYSIQPSHLDREGLWMRKFILDTWHGNRDNRLWSLDELRNQLTRILVRAAEQDERGMHAFNRNQLVNAVANAVFANALRQVPTTARQVCSSVADPDISPEEVHMALRTEFQPILGHPDDG